MAIVAAPQGSWESPTIGSGLMKTLITMMWSSVMTMKHLMMSLDYVAGIQKKKHTVLCIVLCRAKIKHTHEIKNYK